MIYIARPRKDGNRNFVCFTEHIIINISVHSSKILIHYEDKDISLIVNSLLMRVYANALKLSPRHRSVPVTLDMFIYFLCHTIRL